jgi:hypothetical protein
VTEDADCGWDSDGKAVKTRRRDGYQIRLFSGDEKPTGVCVCDAKIDCGCGCSGGCCVLIGEVQPKDNVWTASYDNVRRLRPILTPCGPIHKSGRADVAPEAGTVDRAKRPADSANDETSGRTAMT